MKAAATIPTRHLLIDHAERAAVDAALVTGALSGTAPVVQDYERALASAFDTRFAVACSSGTAAVHLALLALEVRAGDEVILPATAPVMTALPILALGARPVFADVVSPCSFALNLEEVDRKLSPRTRAVVSVPMWGYPADGASLVAACAAWDLPLVEDAAQAHGTRIAGRLAGTQGAIGAFSTHARKLMTTGEGGFLLTDDAGFAGRLHQLHALGQTVRLEGATETPDGPFGNAFGLNYKLAAPLAALGICQLGRLPQRIADRRAVAARLLDGLRDLAGLTPFPVAEGGTTNGYALLVTLHTSATAVAERLAAAGIVSDTLRYQYQPLPCLPLFGGGDAVSCPNARKLCASLLTLPCHEGLSVHLQDEIERAVRDAVQQTTDAVTAEGGRGG